MDRLGHALDNGGDTLGKHTKTALNKLNDIVNQDDQQNLSQTGNYGEHDAEISTLTILVMVLLLLAH